MTTRTKTDKTPIKQFKRIKTLKEIREACKKRRWKLESKRYDEGSDFVSFKFKIKTLGDDVCGLALFNTISGRLFGTLTTGESFSSDSAKDEHKLWFQMLMETVYAS